MRCASARLVDDVVALASEEPVEDLLDGPALVFGQLADALKFAPQAEVDRRLGTMGLCELGSLLEAQELVGGHMKGRREREDDLGGGIARLGFVVGNHPAGDLRLVRELLLGEAGRLA